MWRAWIALVYPALLGAALLGAAPLSQTTQGRAMTLTDWASDQELQSWAAEHVRVFLVTGSDGQAQLNGASLDPHFGDCDDYARRLRNLAAEDGRYLSLQLVQGGAHMGNLAIVGNEMYYLEPMTGEICDWGPLD